MAVQRLVVLCCLCAAVVAAVACSGSDESPAAEAHGEAPAESPATVSPADAAAAEEVAAGFLEAFGAFDADRAITYLADDANLSGLDSSLVGWRVPGAPGDEFRRFVAWHEAVGYKQMLHPCERWGDATSYTELRCPFDVHSLRSDEIGLGPYGGSYWVLTVRDGEIVRASSHHDIAEFSPEVWEPFERWVRTAYPEDAALMYGPEGTEESIQLWEQRTREYVDRSRAASEDWGPVGTDSLLLTVGRVAFSFSLQAGDNWERFGSTSINKDTVGDQGAEAIIFWTSFPGGGNASPCQPLQGASAADLAAAVASAPGTELVRGPSDVTVGGRAAKHVVVTAEDNGCDPGFFFTWPAWYGGAMWMKTTLGDTIRMWIVDVDGTPFVIEAETRPNAGPEVEQEIQQFIESIRFEAA